MKYNMLTILDLKRFQNKVKCLCDCGNEKMINYNHVVDGRTRSCGCLKKGKMRLEASKRFTGKQPSNFRDFTGKKIGLINVIERIEDRRIGTTTYLCRCECGTEFKSEISSLRRSCYLTCECGPSRHPLKKTLIGMINRCENPDSEFYRYYGGKGIKVFEEWKKFPVKFIQWSESNGWHKKEYVKMKDKFSIDRIDSNKDYCPENCHWITVSENSKKAMDLRWGNL